MALASRIDRLEEALSRLAEAAAVQALIQQMGALTLRVDDLAQQVGRLANIIGFTLEDLARAETTMHPLLAEGARQFYNLSAF